LPITISEIDSHVTAPPLTERRNGRRLGVPIIRRSARLTDRRFAISAEVMMEPPAQIAAITAAAFVRIAA
jgi:hypothetical protein